MSLVTEDVVKNAFLLIVCFVGCMITTYCHDYHDCERFWCMKCACINAMHMPDGVRIGNRGPQMQLHIHYN